MTTLFRVRADWTGFPGGPGVSTFYFLDVDTAVSELVDFYAAIGGAIPPDVTIVVERTGDTIEDTTGALTGSWASGPVNSMVGHGGATYAAPAGACITWLTDTVIDGHRLRGRTFIVPMSADNFQNDGSLIPTGMSGLSTPAEALVFAENASMVIWHRPFAGTPAVGTPGSPGYRPARAAHAGGHALVTAPRVADKVAILRSRRD